MSEPLLKNDDWFTELIAWADENDISDTLFPRNKDQLLALTELRLIRCELTKIPEAIGHLKITFISCQADAIKDNKLN